MTSGADLGGADRKVRLEIDAGVAEVVIDSPPLNLFDARMVADLEGALARVSTLAAEGVVRAVLLRAAGRAFCAGVDVHEFQGLDVARGALLMSRFLGLTKTLEELPVPTVAVVHALDLTIGFELALSCDMLWAAERATFGLVEATVGLTPGAGGTQRLAARAGSARAAELIMTGDIYSAAELHSWGVVNRVFPAEVLLQQSREFVARLAAGPTAATAQGKRILQTAVAHGGAAADAITPGAAGQAFGTQDLVDGIASLLRDGPRKATFQGR
jgi:enoyl-CoA hydratase/carnithine racemase